MYYKIITSKNFEKIETLSKSKINEIDECYKLNSFDNYGVINFIVMGENALQMFREKYGAKLNRYAEPIKTDGKTTAKLIPYFLPEFYYDARDGHHGLTNYNDYTEIQYLIEFNGVLLDTRNYGGKTARLFLFNDTTDYRTYLPHEWENENEEPQKVGVLTDKKLKAWYDYLTSKKAAAENEKNRRENKVTLFMERIKSVDTSKFEESFISEKSGYFISGGLRYSYTIVNGYISENLEIYYKCKKNLDSFLNMTK